jgi:hypothetical protein
MSFRAGDDAHAFSSSPLTYDFVVEEAAQFDLWATRNVPGAIVEDSWWEALRTRAPGLWFKGARLLEAATREQMSKSFAIG